MAKNLTFVFFDLSRAIVSQLVTGYLPSVILHFLSSYVPSIMKLFSTMQGFVSVSGIERSACNKMLRFTIWTVFFANVLTGSALNQLNIFLDPKKIPERLAVVVPAQVGMCFLIVVSMTSSLWCILRESYHELLLRSCSPVQASYNMDNNLSVDMDNILTQLHGYCSALCFFS